MTDIFGAIKVADDLEQAAIDTLSSWFPVYIRELEVQHGIALDALPLPRSYLTADRVDRSNADQLPSVVVVSPGLSGRRPQQEGDGTFRCSFSLGIGVFVAGYDRTATKRLVRQYTAIARTIMLQKQGLSGYADGTTWLDESYDDDFSFTDGQTVGAGQTIFEVDVAGVVSRYGGPAVYGGPPPAPNPATQPGALWPEVAKATATVEVKE